MLKKRETPEGEHLRKRLEASYQNTAKGRKRKGTRCPEPSFEGPIDRG